MVASQNELGMLLPPCCSGNVWPAYELSHLFHLRAFTCEVLGICLLETFDHSSACDWSVHSYSLWLVLVLDLFTFSIPGSVLEDCAFLRIRPFVPGYHFIVMQLFLIVSYDPFSFCDVCCNVSFFISSWCESSPCFSWWVWLMICQFCLCSPKHIFLFYWSLLVFPSFPFISALIFMISLLLLTLEVLWPFSSFSRFFRC